MLSTEDIGRVIVTTRKQQGLTQEALAAACGVGTRFIRELEHGKATCHLGKTLHVLHMLGLSVEIRANV